MIPILSEAGSEQWCPQKPFYWLDQVWPVSMWGWQTNYLMYVKNQYVKYYFRTDFHRKEKKVKSKSPRQQVSRFKNDPRVSNFRKCQLCYCPFLTFFLYYQNSYHVFDFLFSPHTLCSFMSRQHLGKGNMEAIKQPVGV